jgi:hypothetical protein
MAAETQLLYLEPDDEITSVVRRLRETDAARVVLVASGRTRATSSAVALRLLGQVAKEEGREIALVADPAARALAGEAGIDGFTSVAEANADGATPVEAPAPKRARIRVVRAEAAPAVPLAPAPARAPVSAPPVTPRLEETQAVPAVVPAPDTPPQREPRPRAAPSRRNRAAAVALIVLVLLLALATAAGAVLLPAATIHIIPATVSVGPERYEVRPEVRGPDEGVLEDSASGTATGTHVDLTAATGVAIFLNWGGVSVQVPAGTSVSAASEIFFTTDQTVVVPPAQFTPDGRVQAGEASVAITAAEPGPGSNVGEGAVDTVEDARIRFFLRGLPNNKERLVQNPDPVSGGDARHQPRIRRSDVDAVVHRLRENLHQMLDEHRGSDATRLYPQSEDPKAEITVPDDLVGRVGDETFELSGTLTYSLQFVRVADVEAAARSALQGDAHAAPAGTQVLPDSIAVDVGQARTKGEAIVVIVRTSGVAARRLDENAIRQQASGKTDAEVQAALGGLGEVQVDFWPGWVDRVPGIDARIDVQIEASPSSPPGG